MTYSRTLLATGSDEPELKRSLAGIMSMIEQWVALQYYRGLPATEGWVSFKLPHPLDYHHLVETRSFDAPVPGCICRPTGALPPA